MTLNESAMIIDFKVSIEVNEREFTGLEDGEILAKFISVDEYNAMIEDTGIEDYSYSEYLGVFETVKPTLLKDLANFRDYANNR